MAINTANRIAVRNEIKRKATHNLPILSLYQMTDMLQTLASEKTIYARDPVLAVEDSQAAANVMAKNPPRDKQPRNPKNVNPGDGQGHRPNNRRLTTTKDVGANPNS